MLDNWSAIDMRRAIGYIASCRTYEGGYGWALFCETRRQIVTFSSCGRSGGTTYIAIGSLHLVSGPSKPSITPTERQLTIGFVSRSLFLIAVLTTRCCTPEILGAGDLVDIFERLADLNIAV
ncbi:hypothetical protein E4T56_gene2673 [Termitomyces sp. T112]|nr:hypothetical protein E4T56_gene2673 [Termitomyces sp. T112]